VPEIRNGLAEAIKTAIIDSRPLFDFISENSENLLKRDITMLSEVLYDSAMIKVKLLEKDPYENDLRRELNFGHTIAHAMETEMKYGLKHGQAVSIGMATAARIAHNRNICSKETRNEILTLLEKISLPISMDKTVNPSNIWKHIEVIRMIRGGDINFVLPKSIGEVVISNDIDEQDLNELVLR